MKRILPILLALTAPLTTVNASYGQSGRTVARLFWKNETDATLRWGDLKNNDDGYLLDEKTVEGFPDLDAEQQSLVQMQADAGLMIVGVRDVADGTIGSGWVAIDSGVKEIPHGDHSHWNYSSPPTVVQALIDAEQGNPAHVYKYGRTFVLANDQKNGFTLTTAAAIRSAEHPEHATGFFPGGNSHITLAVIEDRVAYATWIASTGEDAGRVDVVGLGANVGKGYSIQCPSGGLHGATANSGKAFFAPADGVCWVTVDGEVDDNPELVPVHHLSLGKDADDKPIRTGAFTNLGKHVLFTAGKSQNAKLCLINAAARSPKLIELPVAIADGQSLGSPITMKSMAHGPLACLFAESAEAPENDQLWIAKLDPNADGDFADAELLAPIAVGPSQLVGHSGHHAAAMLPSGRQMAVTNPGDALIWILTLSDWSVAGKLKTSGAPASLIVMPQ